MTDLLLLRRRKFVTIFCGAAIAWPYASRAQQSAEAKRVAVLMSNAEADPEGVARIAAFRRGLERLGWTAGRNLHIETRWAGADIDRIRSFTAELVALAPDVIGGNSS